MSNEAVAPRPGRRLKRAGLGIPFILIGSLLVTVVCLFPFAWMGLSSIKTLKELYTVPPIWWPDVPTLGNYAKVLPVTRVEDRNFQPGPVYKKARELYFDYALKGKKA